jgi:hypothetical protein
MPTIDESNIKVILAALKTTTSETERRAYARVIARHLEVQLAALARNANALVDALTGTR